MAQPFIPKVKHNRGEVCAVCGKRLKMRSCYSLDYPQAYSKDGQMFRPNEVQHPLRTFVYLFPLGPECAAKIPAEYQWKLNRDFSEEGTC